MGREYELKYRASEESLAHLHARFPALAPVEMQTIYYEVPGGLLGKLHWTLRLRTENGSPVCTLKVPLPDGSRGEWETPCSDIVEAVTALCELGAPKQLLALTARGVLPLCGARFTRLCGHIRTGESVVELALDHGVLTGGGREAPFSEVEVELKTGCDADAAAFAGRLAGEENLCPEPLSKVARARALTIGAGEKDGV